ncbi:MAG TPA: DUF5671 domain-containing protein [Acidimicrobiia bacterium]|jgi:hypothetical protein
MIFFGFAVLFGAVVLGVVVALSRRGDDRSGGGDAHGVRRFFQYLLLYALLLIVANGLAGLLGWALGGPDSLALRFETSLARNLSFVLIGLPLYAALGWWSLGKLRSDPRERQSFGWLFYSTAATTTALVVAMTHLHDVVAGLAEGERWYGSPLVSFVVWGGLWVVHWLVIRRLAHRIVELPLLVGSAIGLLTAAVGLAQFLSGAIEMVAVRNLLLGDGPGLGEDGATLLVGAAAWIPNWWAARTVTRSPLWLGYVFVLGVGGGLATVLTAAGAVLQSLLVWWVGDPRTTDAARHFSDVPEQLSAAIVGGIVWWYHRALVAGPATERTEPKRIYEYLMAGIGLLAAAGGLTALLVAFFEAVTGSPTIVEGTSAINTLLRAATFLLIGAPVWWFFWRRIAREKPEAEIASPTRRIYLFTILGLSSVAAVVALITAVFILFEDLLAGTVGADTLRSLRIAVASLITTGVLAAYHWAVYRGDRRLAPTAPERPRFVLLIGPADDEITKAVRDLTKARVQLWRRADTVPPWSVDAVVAALAGVSADEVVVVAGPDGPQVIEVERD